MKAIYILVSLILFSCGSRKVNISNLEIKKDSLSQIDTKIVTKEIFKNEIKNDILIEEFTIKPFDTLKDIVINGVNYKNAIISYKKVKDNTLHINNKITSKIKHKQQNTNVSIIKKEFKKVTDKKFNYLLLLWLLLIPILYLIYRFWIFKFFV